jgi:hypothetical protein
MGAAGRDGLLRPHSDEPEFEFPDARERVPAGEASVVFHGHAHNGNVAGKTVGNVPVINVALPVLLRSEKRQFFLYKL